MKTDYAVLKNDERAVLSLRSLYERYGYSQYKMSKFEEYELYVRNKDFLVSDSVITFTDTNGRLMALKPDVTLSIIKNAADLKGCVQKVYYNENVYRVSGGSHSFKEIMQVGLECIGDIDDYAIFEVLNLAAQSLSGISERSVLDISHMGIVSAVLESIGASGESARSILRLIGDKNIHGILDICRKEGISDEGARLLKRLVSTYGKPEKVLPELYDMACGNPVATAAVSQLKGLVKLMEGSDIADKISIDFSVINDMRYYNGIVFKGFVEGIPSGILSGGQYDKLMKKMGKKSGAIGFAVYLDMLERLSEENKEFDVDSLVLYNDDTDILTLKQKVDELASSGKSVVAQRRIPDNLRYKNLIEI